VNDLELSRRMGAGDERAFDEFFEAYFAPVYRFALARLRDEQAAREVAQLALERAAFAITSYRGEAALFTWLCTIARRELLAHLRRTRRAGRPVELSEDSPEVRAALESLAREPPPGSDEDLRRQEVARTVQLTLDALPRRYGDALEWKYVLGLSVEEIADRLTIGPKAAESLLSRARQAFRDGWASHGLEPRGGVG
jgi:RNA polymerase sigma-70 factor (ECF subfamily)